MWQVINGARFPCYLAMSCHHCTCKLYMQIISLMISKVPSNLCHSMIPWCSEQTAHTLLISDQTVIVKKKTNKKLENHFKSWLQFWEAFSFWRAEKVLNGSFPVMILYALSFDINFHIRTGSFLVWRSLMTHPVYHLWVIPGCLFPGI